MRVAIGQINTTVGDLDGNVAKVRTVAAKAHAAGADLVIFPELTIPGYPPLDLLFEPAFLKANREKIDELAQTLPAIPTVIGFAEPREAGKPHNAAALIVPGHSPRLVRKALLPTYDVFDEARYFTPRLDFHPVELPTGERLGLHICEDMWDDDYDAKPCRALAAAGADLLVNISASPFLVGKPTHRIDVARRRVAETGLPMVYVNLVGAQDELIFDGHSFVLDATGRLVDIAKGFEEDFLVVDVPPRRGPSPKPELPMPEIPREEALRRALVLGVHDYFGKQRIRAAAVGLSGGIDSALVATLAADALGPERVIGVAMPSKHSSEHSVEDARALAESLGIEFHVVPIQESVDVAMRRFESLFGGYKHSTTVENLQARERGKILMEIANDRGCVVLSTGNKTELALGYCTLYGDMCGGLSVIADLSKRDVYAVARHLNQLAGRARIPERTIAKTPSAELSEGQVDPFDYNVVSPLVDDLVEHYADREWLIAKGYPPAVVDDAIRRYDAAEFKRRQAPIGLKVTSRAFGIGRRLPIAQRWTRT